MLERKRSKPIVFGLIVLIFVVGLVGCGAGASRLAPERAIEQSDDVAAHVPMPTLAPVAAAPGEGMVNGFMAPEEAEKAADESDTQLTGAPVSLPLARYDRKIIKNAELTLQVQDTAAALDQVTAVATDHNGYIVNSRVWSEGTYRLASVTLGVPAEEFEQVLRRLRGLAIKVMNEQASGQDVTDQYVDLESRLRNLEATQTRVRAFLDQAVTVEEALEVNRQLSEIEGQIEEIKGKMNYLKERAAYSTITVYLEPERPTPTPTPTATLPAWKPVETFNEASNSLAIILRFLGDLVIWLAVIFLPFLIPLVVIIWLIIRWSKRRPKRQ